jgi:hypothetical protein
VTEGRKFPSFDAYQAALQHPESCFSQNDLKTGKLETDLWGFPRVRSGGFALTYRVNHHTQSYAVRCFHKNVQDRYFRYQAIAAAILRSNCPFLINIHYSGKGVRVGNTWYPVTIMPWLDGETLEGYIYKNLDTPARFTQLAEKFVKCIQDLQQNILAHGDLSHQNILIKNDQIFLVDYDGMFVPSLAGRMSCEIGHNNFQHPGRTMEYFNKNLDNFSAIVIYLALQALAINPDLWKKYETSGDGLLFRKKDFLQPYESPLLQELETYQALRKYIYVFRKICLSQIENIPTLNDFIQLNVRDLPHDEIYVHKSVLIDREIALDATRRYPLVNHIGKVVTVVGNVTDIYSGKTKDGQPHIFINFGNWKAGCFTIVLWGDGYQRFISSPLYSELTIINQWVSVTGILTNYKRRPQIALDTGYGVEILANETEAKFRLGINSSVKKEETISPVSLWMPKQTVIEPAKTIQRNSPEIVLPSQPVDLERIRNYERNVRKKIEELYKTNLAEDTVKKLLD